MDAVKFLELYSGMCNKYDDCVDCPMEGEPLCQCHDRKFSHEESERMVEIVENWSKITSEALGKKYIIEVDAVDKNSNYHTSIGWISKSQIEKLKEYKERGGENKHEND